ncbi:MAG: hypothetical protein IIB06_05870 [Bacteroidetes bacterium]|nr:hypothetical protein [Bacteroidota bacterium]
MEPKKKFPLFNKVVDREKRIQNSLNGINGNAVNFLDNVDVKRFFEVHHYRNGGTIHFRKKKLQY